MLYQWEPASASSSAIVSVAWACRSGSLKAYHGSTIASSAAPKRAALRTFVSFVFSSSSSDTWGDMFGGAASRDAARDRRELTKRNPIHTRRRATASSRAIAPMPRPPAESTGVVPSAVANTGIGVVTSRHPTQNGPWGYTTVLTFALAVWTMVPVSTTRSPTASTLTAKRSRFRGAGPELYSPWALYFEP